MTEQQEGELIKLCEDYALSGYMQELYLAIRKHMRTAETAARARGWRECREAAARVAHGYALAGYGPCVVVAECIETRIAALPNEPPACP